MAGNRIHGSFLSYAGVEYDLYIYDADFVASANTHPIVIGDPATGNVWGDPTTGAVWGWDALDELENPPGIQEHELGLPGFTLEYETQNEKLYVPLMPSRFTFKLIFQNETQETFLNALVNSYEGQFLVRVLRNGVLFWSGVLMPDVVSFEDNDFPYEFELTAVDGISRLKSIDYPETPATGGNKETLMAVIFNCLGELETNGFYAAGDDYFITNVNWWEDRHVASYNAEPLAMTRLNNGVFRRLVDAIGATYEYKNCYDVLFQICQLFGARLYHSAGKWHMMQLTGYSLPSQPRRVYTKTAVLTYSTGGQSYERLCDQDNLARARGRYEYLPAINRCTVQYQYQNSFDYLANGGWDAIMPNDGTNGSDLFDIGEIGSNNGVAVARFRTDIQHKSEFQTLSFVPVRHKFALKLKIGSYYLSRPSTYINFTDITYSAAAWSSSSAAVVEFWTNKIPAANYELCNEFLYVDPATGGNYAFEIISPPILEDGDAEIDFYWVQTRDEDDNIIVPSGAPPNVVIYWGTSYEEIQIWGDGNQYSENASLEYFATNPQTGNSTNINLASYLGDGPSNSVISHLETWNGSTWAESELWGAGLAGARDKKLLELLASKIVAAQLTPRIKFVGSLINTTAGTFFDAFHRLQILNKYYVFMGGDFDGVTDTWTNIHLFHISTEIEPDTQADVPKN